MGGRTSAEPGSAQANILVVKDIDAARDDLINRGVDVSEVEEMKPLWKALNALMLAFRRDLGHADDDDLEPYDLVRLFIDDADEQIARALSGQGVELGTSQSDHSRRH
jgi:hypothetical protein